MTTFGSGIEIFNKNTPGAGSVVGADNGLSLDGTGTLVYLGGVLLEDTTIDAAGFQFQIFSSSFIQLGADTGGGDASQVRITPGVINLFTLVGGNYIGWRLFSSSAEYTDDINGIGFKYNQPYLSGGFSAYGYNYIPCLDDIRQIAPYLIGQAELAARTVTETLLTMDFSTIEAGADVVIRISSYLHVSSVVTGGVKLTVTYRNMSNVLTTLDICPYTALAGDLGVQPITIKVFRNTILTVQSDVLAGGINYDMGTYVERLYTF